MTYTPFKTLRAWERSNLPYEAKMGPSPGGAADQLGVSRQTVYAWVKRGILDRVDVLPEDFKPLPKWAKAVARISDERDRAAQSYSFITLESIHRVQKILLQLAHEHDLDLSQANVLQGANITRELEARLKQLELPISADLDDPD
jgi:DNA-binding XRE family transcriptional regulator